jgi:hypothetical protein
VNYVYEGPGPHVDAELGLVRPGDVRWFDEEPSWGPWRPLGDAMLAASAPVLEPPPPAPASTPAASTTTAADTPAPLKGI